MATAHSQVEIRTSPNVETGRHPTVHQSSCVAEAQPKERQINSPECDRRLRDLLRGIILYEQLPDLMNHISCSRSLDPGRRMQAIESDFGVEIAFG